MFLCYNNKKCNLSRGACTTLPECIYSVFSQPELNMGSNFPIVCIPFLCCSIQDFTLGLSCWAVISGGYDD